MRAAVRIVATSAVVGIASAAWAAPEPPLADAAPPKPASAAGTGTDASCVERLPTGRPRPPIVERFPERGTAGHVLELVVEVEHLPGERVLPGDLRLHTDSPEGERLEKAGFFLPLSEVVPPRLERQEGESPRTTLTLPVVPLPPEAGRHELVLPALPIAMARASGEVFVLCTQPHAVQVEDPLVNQPEAEPRPNPEPRRQREVWEAAKEAFLIGLAALVTGALLAWLVTWWRKRPRSVPAPPVRLPWEVAEEALYDLERAGLIAAGRFDEHFERVADVIRRYLGERYGFDGLECTSRETLRMLRAIVPPIKSLPQIKSFLQQADLVKFARLTPSEEECKDFLDRARRIIQRTLPTPEIEPLPEPTLPERSPSHPSPAESPLPDTSRSAEANQDGNRAPGQLEAPPHEEGSSSPSTTATPPSEEEKP